MDPTRAHPKYPEIPNDSIHFRIVYSISMIVRVSLIPSESAVPQAASKSNKVSTGTE
jgi:hypothetical protein